MSRVAVKEAAAQGLKLGWMEEVARGLKLGWMRRQRGVGLDEGGSTGFKVGLERRSLPR